MYYQGDYYQGDYYQGDPFLGGLIGAGVGWLAKKIFKRQLSKTAMTRAGTGIVSSAYRGAGRIAPAVGAGVIASGMSIPLPGRFTMHPSALVPGGAPLFTREPRLTMSGKIGSDLCCPSGYHPNKSVSRAKATMGAEPGTICVSNRSMNVANPRALRRGLRRVSGFGKLAMRAKKSVRAAAKSLGA